MYLGELHPHGVIGSSKSLTDNSPVFFKFFSVFGILGSWNSPRRYKLLLVRLLAKSMNLKKNFGRSIAMKGEIERPIHRWADAQFGETSIKSCSRVHRVARCARKQPLQMLLTSTAEFAFFRSQMHSAAHCG